MDSLKIQNNMYVNEDVNIKDKIIIITGANRGLGKATAHELAKRGGKIYFACRNEESTIEAINEIKNSTKNYQLFFLKLDLGSLECIREFSRKFHELENRLDILLNNAGNMVPLQRTSDGFEMNFGVNHLGHFLLTNLLLDLLIISAPSRIVVVASSLHSLGTIIKDDINSEKSFKGTVIGYATSKLCNILFVRELSKRLEGTGVVCNAVCPGPVKTDAIRDLNLIEKMIIRPLKMVLDNTPEVGCQPIVMLAVEPSISEVTGKYYNRFEQQEPSLRGQNYEEWLWEKSEELTKLK